MKKNIMCMLGLAVFLFAHTAFAANWTLVMKFNNPLIGSGSDYIDSDSVVKNGDTIIFWKLSVGDKPDFSGTKKELQKIEAKLTTPRQARALELYWYDSDGKAIFSNPGIKSTFSEYNPGSPMEKWINAAAQYAKEGKDTGEKPAP